MIASDGTEDAWPIVQPDRPFCPLEDDNATVEISARRGSGRFAAEVWMLKSYQRARQGDAGTEAGEDETYEMNNETDTTRSSELAPPRPSPDATDIAASRFPSGSLQLSVAESCAGRALLAAGRARKAPHRHQNPADPWTMARRRHPARTPALTWPPRPARGARAMADDTEPLREDEGDKVEGEGEKKRLFERAIPEIFKRVVERAVESGIDKLSEGPENLRHFVRRPQASQRGPPLPLYPDRRRPRTVSTGSSRRRSGTCSSTPSSRTRSRRC